MLGYVNSNLSCVFLLFPVSYRGLADHTTRYDDVHSPLLLACAVAMALQSFWIRLES
jgi:hypothetical protein